MQACPGSEPSRAFLGRLQYPLVFPFTRLVHVLVVPNPYLWRKTQVVIWNWDRKRIRQSN